jgi:hypothetical protein
MMTNLRGSGHCFEKFIGADQLKIFETMKETIRQRMK